MASPSTDRREGLVGNTAYKAPVTVVATVNVTLSGEQTIDTVALLAVNAAGKPDRVLLTGQTNTVENGIWDVATGAWSRSKDADGNFDFVKGSQVIVSRGSAASTIWILTAADPITIGTSSLTWSQGLTTSFLPTLAASGGSALIGFLQAGTGAVARTVQAKLRELISSDDFGGTRGSNNWGLGTNALDSVAPAGAGTGVENIGIGTDALTALTEGFGNTSVGYRALRTLTTPAYCTAVGIRALENANMLAANPAHPNLACTAVGAYALNANTDGQYNVGVGYLAGTANTTGFFNVWVGTNSGATNIVGSSNVGVGHATLNLATGSRNVALGAFALKFQTTGNDSVGIGYQALAANQTGSQSVGIGTNALASATGAANIAIGYLAAQSVVSGTNNVVISPTGGLGTASGAASRNIAIGTNALNALTTNSDNTAVGYNALALSINGGSCAFGSGALDVQTNGGSHAAFGTDAGGNVTTGANTLCLGNQAGTDAVRNITTGSNEIVVGNNSHTAAYIKIAWTVTSDLRDKLGFAPIDRGMEFVDALTPGSFRLKNRETGEATTGKRFGFGAQDILALEGEDQVLIDASDPENLKLRESMMVPILVKALQEVNASLAALRAEFNTYKAAHP